MKLRLALRELLHARLKLRVALLVLLVGFVGPLFSSALRSSVDVYLLERSRQILSADIALSSLRPLTVAERVSVNSVIKPVKRADEIEFTTMARGLESSTLIEVRAVSGSFPVRGSFKTRDGRLIHSAEALETKQIAWVYPEVLAQLGLQIGERIGLGRTEFEIVEVLEDGPGLTRGGGFAPRLYIGRSHLEKTGLAEFGSQISHRLYLELPPEITSATAEARIKNVIQDPDVFFRTPGDATAGFERFFNFFKLYLVSISMIVFALSWVSAFYILQIFLQERLRSAAVLLVFGASRLATVLVPIIQVFLLMTAALLASFALVWGAIAFVPIVARDFLPKGFELFIGASDLLRMLVVALISTIAFLLPLFVRLYRLKLIDLLGETAMGSERLPRVGIAGAYFSLAAVFVALSAWLMDSWQNALLLTGGILLSSLIGWVVARLSFRLFFQMMSGGSGLARHSWVRLVAMQLARSRFGMNLCFVTLFLAALVLNLVPHLLRSSVAEIEPLEGREIPALFLFNIPEFEVERLKSFALEKKFELRNLAPMVQGRLVSVNGAPTSNDQFRRFPVRLTYRDGLLESERLAEGRAFSGFFDTASEGTPEVSIEKRWAERNDIQLGDRIEFDVQGVPVGGRVTSLRNVKWTNFTPNFFIVFQPGVLEEAPKTYLANVNFGGILRNREALKVAVQFQLVRDFPDLNVIDVGRTLDRALEVVRSILGPVRVAAAIAIAMSFLILLGVMIHNLGMREPEVDVMKILGADASLIRRLITCEYALSAGFAWLLGSGCAVAMTWVVAARIFEIPFRLDIGALLISLLVVIGTASAIAFVSSARTLGLRGASRKL
jgi:putative ABC transport system permease protein